MRFPSLIRLPKHQQFRIRPRYYDPVKEEVRERTKRIQEEIEGKERNGYQPSRVRFKRKTKRVPITSLIQLSIAVSLGGLIFGWLEYGNSVFEIFLIVILGVYLLYRLKKLKQRR